MLPEYSQHSTESNHYLCFSFYKIMLIIVFVFKIYPNGVWFLFYKGRLEFMRGNLDESVKWYKKSWESQSKWPQFHHMCFWELLWLNW